jgi:hypothetical protein
LCLSGIEGLIELSFLLFRKFDLNVSS